MINQLKQQLAHFMFFAEDWIIDNADRSYMVFNMFLLSSLLLVLSTIVSFPLTNLLAAVGGGGLALVFVWCVFFVSIDYHP